MTAAVRSALAVIRDDDECHIMHLFGTGSDVGEIAKRIEASNDRVLAVVNRINLNRGTAREAVRYYKQHGPAEVAQPARKPKMAAATPAADIEAPQNLDELENPTDEAEADAAVDSPVDNEGTAPEPVPEPEQEEPTDNDTDKAEAETEEDAARRIKDNYYPEHGDADPIDIEQLLKEAETYGLQEHVQAAQAIRRHAAALRAAMVDVYEQRQMREEIAELSRQISELQQQRQDKMNDLKALTGRPSVRVSASDLLTRQERIDCRAWAFDNNEPAPRTGPIPIATIGKWREATGGA